MKLQPFSWQTNKGMYKVDNAKLSYSVAREQIVKIPGRINLMFIAFTEAQKLLLLFVVKDLASYILLLCYIICPGVNFVACLFF